MEDVTPKLIEAVTGEFHRLYEKSAKIEELLAKLKDGSATYAEAQEYSLEVSRIIGAAYEKYVSSASLPDGRMYYNIAQRLIPSTLDENHELVSGYAVQVQQKLNDHAGIGLKVQRAELDQDRVDGLVDLASNAEVYDEVSERILTAFENFSQHIVDETIQKNAQFHYNAGLSPKIVRRAEGKCCKWCRGLAGVHEYPDVDRDVYRRHENCRCTVLYDPADGSKSLQNVHTKLWTDSRDYAKIKSQAVVPAKDDTVIKALKSGEVKDSINKDLQAPHCIDSNKYKHGKSYLYGTVSDAEELFARLKGTGDPVYDKNGNWNRKERVTSDTVVGVWISREGEPEETRAVMIVYSNTGSHIYPRREER